MTQRNDIYIYIYIYVCVCVRAQVYAEEVGHFGLRAGYAEFQQIRGLMGHRERNPDYIDASARWDKASILENMRNPKP